MEKRKHLIVVHYHEIALKGKNRSFFEKALMDNIKNMLGGDETSVRRMSGRIVIDFQGDQEKAESILKKVFGIKNFNFAKVSRAKIKEMGAMALSFFDSKKPYPKSFRVEASRSEKSYPFTSEDIMKEVGAFVQNNTGIRVDLTRPAKTIFIEVAEGQTFIYDEKILGPGGLPIGTAGKVVSLISSGFDSPIASLKVMKRGASVEFAHFHSYPQTTRDSIEQVERLVDVLSGFSPVPLKLHIIPFIEIQKRIIKDIPSSLAIIMYRRWMLKIAEQLARKIGAKALVTGDSLGQVASQTLSNMGAISEAVDMPILRPLVGDDKNEIIDEARRVGTYEISAHPYDDCCNLFISGSPETNSKVEDVVKREALIKDDLEKLATKALAEEDVKMIR